MIDCIWHVRWRQTKNTNCLQNMGAQPLIYLELASYSCYMNGNSMEQVCCEIIPKKIIKLTTSILLTYHIQEMQYCKFTAMSVMQIFSKPTSRDEFIGVTITNCCFFASLYLSKNQSREVMLTKIKNSRAKQSKGKVVVMSWLKRATLLSLCTKTKNVI